MTNRTILQSTQTWNDAGDERMVLCLYDLEKASLSALVIDDEQVAFYREGSPSEEFAEIRAEYFRETPETTSDMELVHVEGGETMRAGHVTSQEMATRNERAGALLRSIISTCCSTSPIEPVKTGEDVSAPEEVYKERAYIKDEDILRSVPAALDYMEICDMDELTMTRQAFAAFLPSLEDQPAPAPVW